MNGTVTNVDLRPGDYVSAGKGVMALVDRDTLHVDGYFEETKLPRIQVGDPVACTSWARTLDLTGHVESIAGGIEDRERSEARNLLANINPSFTWVRLAQRMPVRVTLDQVPDGVAAHRRPHRHRSGQPGAKHGLDRQHLWRARPALGAGHRAQGGVSGISAAPAAT